MMYGITGNTGKSNLWPPVNELVNWLREKGLPFRLHTPLARGLVERGLQKADFCERHRSDTLVEEVDLILSFGGDGTMLQSAHDAGQSGTPLLGINVGRLGFLADVDVEKVHQSIERLEAGHYRVEARTVLEGRLDAFGDADPLFALNEIVLERGGAANLISVYVTVDGRYLNTFWADGLIVSTSTGSTAYSLSVGGPIIAPGSGVIVITPIAPHTLTVRPIVIPNTSVIEAHVDSRGAPYVVASDGRSRTITRERLPIRIQKAAHSVNLIKLPEQDYFDTLRKKLMWGRGTYDQGDGRPPEP